MLTKFQQGRQSRVGQLFAVELQDFMKASGKLVDQLAHANEVPTGQRSRVGQLFAVELQDFMKASGKLVESVKI